MPNDFPNPPRRSPWLALCAALLLGASGPGHADADHDRARQALEAGEVLPLRAILDRVEREFPGQVIDVELEREKGRDGERWVYRIKLLRADGSLVKLRVDARDGTPLGGRSRDRRHGEPPAPASRPGPEGR